MINAKDFYKTYRLNGGKLLYKEYKVVLDKIIEKFIEGILNDKQWIISAPLGYLRFQKVKRDFLDVKKMKVDFNATKLKKQELIEKGITPFEVIRNEAGEIIGNNGGKEYLVYFTEDTFYRTIWGLKDLYRLEITTFYKFKPCFALSRANKTNIT